MSRPLETGESPTLSVRILPSQMKALKALARRAKVRHFPDFIRTILDDVILRNSNENKPIAGEGISVPVNLIQESGSASKG